MPARGFRRRSAAIGGRNLPGTVFRENRQIHIPDLDNLDPAIADWPTLPNARAAGARALAGTPLRREGKAIGALVVHRDRPVPFTDEELALQQSFADQAVIAIENARLFNETREALEQQAATAEILRVINSSPGSLTPVFDAILEKAHSLCDVTTGSLEFFEGDVVRTMAARGYSERWETWLRQGYKITDLARPFFQAVHHQQIIDMAKHVERFPDEPNLRAILEIGGLRTYLALPLVKDGVPFGRIVATRAEVRPFTDKQIALLQSFADQAVIAIENARLFNETREALEQQKATSDLLQVIGNSVADTAPVFEKILDSCQSLFATEQLGIFLVRDGQVHVPAWRGGALEAMVATLPRPVEQTATGLVIQSRNILHVPSAAAMPDMPPTVRNVYERIGDYSLASAPMLRGQRGVGALVALRQPPKPFSDKELALLKTFADQAVIAIENTRLFNETKEALEQQKASADILRAISSSVADTQPAFDKILDSCKHLFGSDETAVLLVDDEGVVTLGAYIGKQHDAVAATFPAPVEKSPAGHAIRERRVVHYTDAANDARLTRAVRHVAQVAGYEAMAYAPMMWNERGIGTIGVSRLKGAFSDKELALLQTFADQAVIAIQNARLFNETREALERQTATADILKVIASTPSDVQPVFEAIAERSNRLIGGLSTAVYRLIDDTQHLMAFTRVSPEADAVLKALFPRPLSAVPWGEQARRGKLVQSRDTEVEFAEMPALRELARQRGFRSFLLVPLLREGVPIGLISVTRKEPGAFAAHHVQLLQTFADQAVIAIENTRLFNETREALERQTATADILKVIASSPSDVQPVFEAIAASANRLIGGLSTAVHSLVDDTLHLTAFTPTSPAGDAALQASFPRPLSTLPWGEQMRNGELVHIPDVEVEGAMLPDLRDLARMRGFRSLLRVPLLRDRTPIGFISVTRVEPGRFAAHHVQLLQTFADQAVIAIENTRLFNETREALERQTATADILKVIASSPSDVQPVFEAIATSANRLIGGFSTAVLRFVDGVVHLAAFTPTNPAADEALEASLPRPLAEFPPFELVREGEAAQVIDTELEPGIRDIARLRGYRSMLFAPLMSNGVPIGQIGVTRTEPGSFADHHVQLLQTFADQAVIAIENTRLFNETREALERQTATADILKVIASSPSDVQPVFDAIATTANRLIGGFSTAVFRFVDGVSHLAAFTPTTPAADEILKSSFPRTVELAQAGEVVQIADVETSPDVKIREIARARGFRSMLLAPLMSKGAPIGRISVTRVEPGSFSLHHLQLLQTFADQAVIAIENVRLFDEVQARTEDLRESLQQQTATADVLKVISRSAFDLQTVLDTLTESAARLCNADMAAILRQDARGFYNATNYNFAVDWVRLTDPFRFQPERGSVIGRVLLGAARPFKFRTSSPIRNTAIPICRKPPAIAQSSAFLFCAEKSRSAFCFCAARRSNPSPTNRSNWFRPSPTRP